MGHISGPDSANVNSALGKVDQALGRLVAGLKARGIFDKINLIVVSDHGMTGTSAKRMIFLDDLIELKHAVVTATGGAAGVNPLPGNESEIEAVLLAPRDHMRCWRRSEIPPSLHYGTNARTPTVLCLGDLGWMVTTRAAAAQYPQLLGDHGYDPSEPDMAALFIAHGPAFRSAVSLPSFDNIDVYPLLVRLLGVPAEPNDGHIEPLLPALAG
jgi:predicted AlkP superfamily pyrophosphatase or phosphodiesterase